MVELEVQPRTKVCCVYVPPACSEEEFNQLLDFIQSIPDDCDQLLLGDFNAPDVNWNTLTATAIHSSSLCDAIVDAAKHTIRETHWI